MTSTSHTNDGHGAVVVHGTGRFTTQQFTLRQALTESSPLKEHKRRQDQQRREKQAVIKHARRA